MVQFRILAGGYDMFIATYVFNTVTLSLTLLSKTPSGFWPSWLTTDGRNSSIV